MQNRTLLDRQIELLRCLTGADLLFAQEKAPALAGQAGSLDGVSVAHLRLEAEMSLQKRMNKIAKVLERTCFYLDQRLHQLQCEFAAACPPRSYRSYDEASRFYEFLLNHWKSAPPAPPFIVDVARLEMAVARSRMFRATDGALPPVGSELPQRKPLVRVARGTEILPMDYDVRSVFEGGAASGGLPTRRNHFLMIAPGPNIVEIPEAFATALKRMQTWTALDRVLEESGAGAVDLRTSLGAFLNAGGFLEVVQ